jgi:hypothetical protein
MALYWHVQDFVLTALFRQARRFTCWKQSRCDLQMQRTQARQHSLIASAHRAISMGVNSSYHYIVVQQSSGPDIFKRRLHKAAKNSPHLFHLRGGRPLRNAARTTTLAFLSNIQARRRGARKPQTTSTITAPMTAPTSPAPSPALYQPIACPR